MLIGEMTMNKCTAIISGAPLALAPYLKYYIDLLEANNMNYILLNVEETGEKVCDSPRQIIFRCPVRPGAVAHIRRSVSGLLFIIRNLVRNRCGRIIIAPTRTGIKLEPLLRLFYWNRYIFDIRDHTNEDDPSYKRKEDKLIAASAATFISSRGYLKWISPSNKIRVTHNIPVKYNEYPDPRAVQHPIRIESVGMVSYYHENRTLIDKLGGNSNYYLGFYGDRSGEWSDAVVTELQEKYKNVHFYDHFNNDEKPRIYEKTDLINGIYGDTLINVKTLTPNRLYDAAIYKIPIIVSSGTWVAECVNNYGIGLTVNVFKDDIAEKITAYFSKFDAKKFVENSRRFLSDVSAEQRDNADWLINFLK